MNKNEAETWKSIKGMEALFKISNLGRVMSIARKQRSFKISRNQSQRFLTPRIDTNGFYKYWYYQLYVDGKRKKAPIHRLLALHFLRNPKKYKYVQFKDGDLNNYSLSNLEWAPSPIKNNLTNK